jgi:hypothetical protein
MLLPIIYFAAVYDILRDGGWMDKLITIEIGGAPTFIYRQQLDNNRRAKGAAFDLALEELRQAILRACSKGRVSVKISMAKNVPPEAVAALVFISGCDGRVDKIGDAEMEFPKSGTSLERHVGYFLFFIGKLAEIICAYEPDQGFFSGGKCVIFV